MGICICRKHEEYEDYTTFSEFIELIDEEVKHIEEISNSIESMFIDENPTDKLNTETQLLEIKANLLLLSGALKGKNESQDHNTSNTHQVDLSQIRFILKEYYSLINQPELLYQKENFVKEFCNDLFDLIKKIK